MQYYSNFQANQSISEQRTSRFSESRCTKDEYEENSCQCSSYGDYFTFRNGWIHLHLCHNHHNKNKDSRNGPFSALGIYSFALRISDEHPGK